MPVIHPSAQVDPAAEIADSAAIGPCCIVGPQVVLGAGTVLHSHVVVQGRTRIGANTEIHAFASIGGPPQDLKYQGEDSELIIGDSNRIREHVTMNTGTRGGGMVTRIGDRGLFMVGAHVAHDCLLGDNVILANNATLGGHVSIGDFAVVGGMSAIHQFVRIGQHAIIGGMTGVEFDVIPFGLAKGARASLDGLNLVGLKRRDFARADIRDLRAAWRMLFTIPGDSGDKADNSDKSDKSHKSESDTAHTLEARVAKTAALFPDTKPVQDIVAFIRTGGSRGITQPRAGHHGA